MGGLWCREELLLLQRLQSVSETRKSNITFPPNSLVVAVNQSSFEKKKKKHGQSGNATVKYQRHLKLHTLNFFPKINFSSQVFQHLESFSIIMYDKSRSLESINAARRELFAKCGEGILENIPPTQVRMI